VTSVTNTYTFEDLTAGLLYRFKVAAINSIGQGEFSKVVAFYACTNPADPENFSTESQGEDHLTVEWELPLTSGGCPVIGYRVWMENIEEPGLKIVYNGVSSSTKTSVTLTYPNVKPGQYYKL
jgi:hypothetical protein